MITTDLSLETEFDNALSAADERTIKTKIDRLKRDHGSAYGLLERLSEGQGGLTADDERELSEAFGKVGLTSTPRQQVLNVFAKTHNDGNPVMNRNAPLKPGRREEFGDAAAVEPVDLDAGDPEEIIEPTPTFATRASEIKPT